MTHLIAIFTLLWWSGARPAIALRCVCICLYISLYLETLQFKSRMTSAFFKCFFLRTPQFLQMSNYSADHRVFQVGNVDFIFLRIIYGIIILFHGAIIAHSPLFSMTFLASSLPAFPSSVTLICELRGFEQRP